MIGQLAATSLPTDRDVLDEASNALSDARDWLNSDTNDAIAGRRNAETARLINGAAVKVAIAKAAIDAAKDADYRARAARLLGSR